jgi:hypothetical protein
MMNKPSQSNQQTNAGVELAQTSSRVGPCRAVFPSLQLLLSVFPDSTENDILHVSTSVLLQEALDIGEASMEILRTEDEQQLDQDPSSTKKLSLILPP